MVFFSLGPPRPRPRPHPKKPSRRPLQVLQLLRRKEQTHLQQMHLQRQLQPIPNHECKMFFSPITHSFKIFTLQKFHSEKKKEKINCRMHCAVTSWLDSAHIKKKRKETKGCKKFTSKKKGGRKRGRDPPPWPLETKTRIYFSFSLPLLLCTTKDKEKGGIFLPVFWICFRI